MAVVTVGSQATAIAATAASNWATVSAAATMAHSTVRCPLENSGIADVMRGGGARKEGNMVSDDATVGRAVDFFSASPQVETTAAS
jgi:hypothetical protein